MHGPRNESSRQLSDHLVFSSRSPHELREQYRNNINNAALRTIIQARNPDWMPTDSERYLVGQVRDIAARLHPESLGAHPESTATRISLGARAQIIFARSLRNLAQSCSDKPLERTDSDSLESTPCVAGDPLYRSTYLSSLWAVQSSLAAFSENKPMLRELFAEMHRDLPGLYAILKDDELWQGVASFIYNLAGRSAAFRAAVLEQERWLGWTEADLPPQKGFPSNS